jgi:hypothetical protein
MEPLSFAVGIVTGVGIIVVSVFFFFLKLVIRDDGQRNIVKSPQFAARS